MSEIVKYYRLYQSGDKKSLMKFLNKNESQWRKLIQKKFKRGIIENYVDVEDILQDIRLMSFVFFSDDSMLDTSDKNIMNGYNKLLNKAINSFLREEIVLSYGIIKTA